MWWESVVIARLGANGLGISQLYTLAFKGPRAVERGAVGVISLIRRELFHAHPTCCRLLITQGMDRVPARSNMECWKFLTTWSASLAAGVRGLSICGVLTLSTRKFHMVSEWAYAGKSVRYIEPTRG